MATADNFLAGKLSVFAIRQNMKKKGENYDKH